MYFLSEVVCRFSVSSNKKIYETFNCRCYTNVFRAKLSKKLKEKQREVPPEISCRDSSTEAPGLVRGIDHLRDPRLNKVII